MNDWSLNVYCVVMDPDKRVLVLKRKGEEVWRVPAGTPIESDSDLCITVARIVMDQTGFFLEGFWNAGAYPYNKEKNVVLGYLCSFEIDEQVGFEDDLVLEDGVAESRWVTREEFEKEIRLVGQDHPGHNSYAPMLVVVEEAFRRASEWPIY